MSAVAEAHGVLCCWAGCGLWVGVVEYTAAALAVGGLGGEGFGERAFVVASLVLGSLACSAAGGAADSAAVEASSTCGQCVTRWSSLAMPFHGAAPGTHLVMSVEDFVVCRPDGCARFVECVIRHVSTAQLALQGVAAWLYLFAVRGWQGGQSGDDALGLSHDAHFRAHGSHR